jgi:hypothetical protein
VLAAIVGIVLLLIGARVQRSAPTPSPAAAGVVLAPAAGRDGAERTAGTGSTSPAGLARSAPTGISIPAIGVQSALERLGENPDGTIEVPHSYATAGWFTASVTPGQIGPLVILGHVDSTTGPGVFFRLGQLHPGDLVTVPRADGRAVRYRITGVREYAKNAFPTFTVYGNTPVPTIRLITCGGRFDSNSGHYESNVIAYGQLADR